MTDKDLARFMSFVEIDMDSSCWRWRGGLNGKGYARFHFGKRGRWVLGHRWIYEHKIGPIPVGLELDHVRGRGCSHTDCVNPEHLEPVTHAENMRRSEPARRTHCPRGHAYDAGNTGLMNGGRWRRCLTCHRARENARYAAKRSPQ